MTRILIKSPLFLGTLLLVLIQVSACSNRSKPAPVKELYQGKTFRDFEQQGFEGERYTVQKGDTLYSVAWFSGNDYQDLARLNRISAPYQIYPGQDLLLNKPKNSAGKLKHQPSGLTSKTNANQAVDHSKKQAYGKSEEIVNKGSFEPNVGKFPIRVSSWFWPSKEKVIRRFSAKEQGNKGLDFAGNMGSPILVAADGKVVYTGQALRGFGKLIIVKHSDAYLSAYAHNDQILVKEQQWVKSGQNIATMGRSGTNEVKLHFEVRYKGKSVDPLRYLPKR